MKKIVDLDKIFDYMEEKNYFMNNNYFVSNLEKQDNIIEVEIENDVENVILTFKAANINFSNLSFEEKFSIDDVVFFEDSLIYFDIEHKDVCKISIAAYEVELQFVD